MTQAVPIKLHVSNALRLMGQLYRSPADALKEYVSNAVDRWRELRAANRGPKSCAVDVEVRKTNVAIHCNTAGMSELEFRTVLGRVADSRKKETDVSQIGRLGIGLWGFLQLGTSLHGLQPRRIERGHPARASAREPGPRRVRPGLEAGVARRAGISRRHRRAPVRSDSRPQRARARQAPQAPRREVRETAPRRVARHHASGTRRPRRSPCGLPRSLFRASERATATGGCRKAPPRDARRALLRSSGNGKVAIRHAGVVVVESIADINAYGLESSVYGSGYVSGAVDAEFLLPLPARTMFEENDDWFDLMTELDRLRPSIEAEVEALRHEDTARQLTVVHETAMRLARDILDLPDFRDLALPGGMARSKIGAPARRRRTRGGGTRRARRSPRRPDRPAARPRRRASPRPAARSRRRPRSSRLAHQRRRDPVQGRRARSQPLRRRRRPGEHAESRLRPGDGGERRRAASPTSRCSSARRSSRSTAATASTTLSTASSRSSSR